MSRWNVQDGLFHFVFAGEDAYVQDSLVCLNLTDKLYYELRRRHFDRILFLEGLKGNYDLRLFDEPSWQYCYEQTKNILGGSSMVKEAFRRDPEGQRFACNADQIFRLLNNAEETAFVISLETFDEVFHGQQMFLESLEETNSHRKNLILLTAGITAESSQPLFTGPNGIFQASTARGPLFPEIISAFSGEDYLDEGCYNRLNNYMNNRCVFLNRFSKNAIRRIVRYTAWMQKDPFVYTEDEQKRIAQFIWLWYHEESVREPFRFLFSENEERKFTVLAKELNENWHMVCSIALDELPADAEEHHIHEPFVISHNKPEKLVQAIRFRSEKDEKKYGIRCRRLIRSLQKPRREQPSLAVMSRLERFIAKMSAAAAKDDPETFDRADRAVRYAIRSRFRMDDRNALSWDCHEKILESSSNLFEMEHTVQQYTERIARLQNEADKLRDRIDRNAYDSSYEKSVAAERYVHICKNEIPNQEKLRGYVRDQILDIRRILQQLENAMAITSAIPKNDPEIENLLKSLADGFRKKDRETDLYAADLFGTVREKETENTQKETRPETFYY